jgi:uncharacterized membrane protein
VTAGEAGLAKAATAIRRYRPSQAVGYISFKRICLRTGACIIAPSFTSAHHRRTKADTFGRVMSEKKTTSERLAAFSDAVFAVIITIMVLELKPPDEPTFRALLPLWPTALSYLVSYVFIDIIWVNHHYLFRFTREATARLIWWNFAHLFMISLLPVTTAWMARTRLAAAPVFVYALNFVLIEIAYIAFERTAFAQATPDDLAPPMRRIAKLRSYFALALFSSAAAVSFWSPETGLALVCCVLLIYLSPQLPALLQSRRKSRVPRRPS